MQNVWPMNLGWRRKCALYDWNARVKNGIPTSSRLWAKRDRWDGLVMRWRSSIPEEQNTAAGQRRNSIGSATAVSLWRGELLANAKHVYLTESETDAIALLHTALSRMKSVQPSSPCPVPVISNPIGQNSFKDKVVTLCFDDDDAGKDGANKTGLFLKPFASELLTYELGGAI